VTDHATFYVSGAAAALLDYRAAERPDRPHLLLIFETPEESVAGAGPDDLDCDCWDVIQVVGVIERRLSEHHVPTRRLAPVTFFAEWDLVPKQDSLDRKSSLTSVFRAMAA
jgi:hypothetical protein